MTLQFTPSLSLLRSGGLVVLLVLSCTMNGAVFAQTQVGGAPVASLQDLQRRLTEI